MTPEELLQPRRKLIAPYPHCQYEVGTVLHVAEDGELFSPEYGFSGSQWKVTVEDADKCKQNFKELFWWEERKVEDMPKYLRWRKNIIKIERYAYTDNTEKRLLALFMFNGRLRSKPVKFLHTATEQEYNEYQKQKAHDRT